MFKAFYVKRPIGCSHGDEVHSVHHPGAASGLKPRTDPLTCGAAPNRVNAWMLHKNRGDPSFHPQDTTIVLMKNKNLSVCFSLRVEKGLGVRG